MDTYFIPVPLIGLTEKKSYKIVVELEQFRRGPIKDDTGIRATLENMFMYFERMQQARSN